MRKWFLGVCLLLLWSMTAVQAQSNLRINPYSIVPNETVRFCADGAAGMTVDILYAHVKEDGTTDWGDFGPALTFDGDGCKNVQYAGTDDQIGIWYFRGIRRNGTADWVYFDPWPSLTIHRNGPSGPPRIDSISTERVRQEEFADITLQGANLQKSVASIPQGPNPNPALTSVTVGINGEYVKVRVDCRDSNRILDYYSLVLTGPYGTDSKQFRVIPLMRPIWDVMTPGNPQTGLVGYPARSYVLHIEGWNLDHTAIMLADDRLLVSSQEDGDRFIRGVLEVRPGAAPGPATLYIHGADACTPEYYYYCAITVNISPPGSGAAFDQNLTENIGDLEIPALHLSHSGESDGFLFNPRLEALMNPPDPDGAAGALCGFTRRLFSISFQRNFVFCRESGSFSLDCARDLPVGQVVPLGGFVLSIFFEVDFGLRWRCFPLSWPSLCIKAVIGVEIPGNSFAWASFDYCFFDAERLNQRMGRTDQFTFLSGGQGCYGVDSQWYSGTPGLYFANIVQNNCCAEPLRVFSRGRSGEGTRFASSFAQGDVTCQSSQPLQEGCIVTPLADCTRLLFAPCQVFSIQGNRYRTRRSENEQLDLIYDSTRQRSASYTWERRRQGFYDGGANLTFFAEDYNNTWDPDYLQGINPCGRLTGNDLYVILRDFILNRPQRIYPLYIGNCFASSRGSQVAGMWIRLVPQVVTTADNAPDRTPGHEIAHQLLNGEGDWDLTGVPRTDWRWRNIATQARFTNDVQVTYPQAIRARIEALGRYRAHE